MERKEEALTPPDYVVLGMVWLGARSGYEIKRTVAASVRFFWTISEAQIYPGLARLERAGLVLGRAEPLGKRRRRTFVITAAGETALRGWLSQAQPMAFELRDEGLIRLFFADALGTEEARSLLDSIIARSEERVAVLRAIEPAARRAGTRNDVHPLLTLRIGIAFHEAMINVCREFERETIASSARRRDGHGTKRAPLFEDADEPDG